MAAPNDLERNLAAAIEAGDLSTEQAADQELADAFAAHQKLESLFAVIRNTPNDDPPTQVGRFLIRRKLGQGAFGTVYLAEDPRLNRKVAIKVARPSRFASGEAIDRFLQEARFNARLDHAGIVRVYDMGHDGDHIYIVLEYVPGLTLQDLLNQQGPMPPATAAALVAQIADSLHYAHQKRCYHRDLKPSNVLLDEHGQPRIADFGLAMSEERHDEAEGQRAGTIAYMSPEQASGDTSRLDGRSDIWSLGVIFYQMLTACQPFWSGDDDSSLKRILTRSPQPPRQINDAIPNELERICLKALAKEPADRYTTASDMANDLRAAIATPPQQATAESAAAAVVPVTTEPSDAGKERLPKAESVKDQIGRWTTANCAGKYRWRTTGRTIEFDLKEDGTFHAAQEPDEIVLSEGAGLVKEGKGEWQVWRHRLTVTMTHVWTLAFWKSHRVVWIDNEPITGVSSKEIKLQHGHPLQRM